MDHITLPYRFDTRSVWRAILKGAFSLNALLVVGILFTLLVGREWTTTLGLVLVELLVVGFTLVFIKAQEGSAGTLSSDRIVIEPNILLGIALPGPKGAYMLDRFSAVRVEFRSGRPDVQDSGPHELVWLVGKPGTPDVVLARTDSRAGLTVGREVGSLLRLPVEEAGAVTRGASVAPDGRRERPERSP
jgi:hypothetical protein